MCRKRIFSNRERIWLYICRECGAEELFPQPSPELLSEQYFGYNARRNALVKIEFPKEDFFTDMLCSNSWLIPKKKGFSVLELGSGGGDFVRAFNRLYRGSKITAVEMNPESETILTKLDCEYFRADVLEFLESCDKRFDIVFMFDVLEHLRDPAKTLSNISRLLNPGGKIVLTAPLSGSLLHRITGRLWPQYKLEHLFYFSAKSFELLGLRAGLKPLKIDALAKKLPVSYLLSVGSNFGPKIFSSLVNSVTGSVPSLLYNFKIKLQLGEAFIVYAKNEIKN
ncbi:MAG: class I SAM-dependent methyltransferase [Deltaproteobacteria bacterium]|nr:class I SAM-dependent methyltransferase [Deltaproteobacteria bacterium]